MKKGGSLMKKGKYLVIGVFAFMSSLSVMAQNSLSSEMQILSDKVGEIEDSMSARDRASIRELLRRIGNITEQYSNGPIHGPQHDPHGRHAVCVSNGETGTWEKFRPVSLSNNQALGGFTSKQTCETLVRTSRRDVICSSNGETGTWEKFRPMSIFSGAGIGGYTSLNTCTGNLGQNKSRLLCISNGEQGTWEKFAIYDLRADKTLGGYTQLNTCRNIVSASSNRLTCVSNGETGTWEKFSLMNLQTQQIIGGQTSLQNCLQSIQ